MGNILNNIKCFIVVHKNEPIENNSDYWNELKLTFINIAKVKHSLIFNF